MRHKEDVIIVRKVLLDTIAIKNLLARNFAR